MAKPPTKSERDHMNRVAELGCIVPVGSGRCGKSAEIHHLRSGQGMGQRADNYSVLPLCPHHHRTGGYGEAIHSGARTWQARFGTEYELLAVVALMLDGGDISP